MRNVTLKDNDIIRLTEIITINKHQTSIIIQNINHLNKSKGLK